MEASDGEAAAPGRIAADAPTTAASLPSRDSAFAGPGSPSADTPMTASIPGRREDRAAFMRRRARHRRRSNRSPAARAPLQAHTSREPRPRMLAGGRGRGVPFSPLRPNDWRADGVPRPCRCHRPPRARDLLADYSQRGRTTRFKRHTAARRRDHLQPGAGQGSKNDRSWVENALVGGVRPLFYA